MKIHENLPLKDILFYKIGGVAKTVLEVTSKEEMLAAFDYIKKQNIEKYQIVGLGANLIMPDDLYDGVIIWITKKETPDIKFTTDNLVDIYAGQLLDDLIQFCFAHNLKGLESLGGLPSTVGGAVRGNAGAFGVEMKDVVTSVETLDMTTGEIKEFINDQCLFSYRDSMFKHNPNLVILRASFGLVPASKKELEEAMKVYDEKIAYRKERHPVEYPSCGSVFKNIRGEDQVQKVLSVWPDITNRVTTQWHGKVSMGYVIKRLGLQGVHVGGAKITEKHANYISNIDNAKYSDVVAIIENIKESFQKEFGFYPELEAEVVQR